MTFKALLVSESDWKMFFTWASILPPFLFAQHSATPLSICYSSTLCHHFCSTWPNTPSHLLIVFTVFPICVQIMCQVFNRIPRPDFGHLSQAFSESWSQYPGQEISIWRCGVLHVLEGVGIFLHLISLGWWGLLLGVLIAVWKWVTVKSVSTI